jgi:osmotically-inducible protein OsmY
MLHKCAALVAAALFTAACAQTDAGITTNVKAKLAADDTVKAYQIDVDTRNGVVTLSGAVETAAAKEQAIQIARGSDGVRDVIDQLQVNEAAATGGMLDRGYDETRQEGREAIETLRETGRDARDTAERTTDRGREYASDAARRTGDVAGRTGAVITDAAITSAVKAKFLADTTVKGLSIDVDTSGGVVTLNGRVASKAEADKATMLARDTEGVKRVVNNMRVGG